MKFNTIKVLPFALALIALNSCKEKAVGENICSTIKTTGTYEFKNHKPGVDYELDCNINLEAGSLTIEPGTHIFMGPNKYIHIGQSSYIHAVGNTNEEIIISGNVWSGLVITSNNPLNRLDFVSIENGGHSDLSEHTHGFGTYYYPENQVMANVVLAGNGNITNLKSINSKNTGILVTSTFSGSLNQIQVSSSKLFPMVVEFTKFHEIPSSLTFLNNSKNDIQIYSNDFYNELTGNVTWKNVGYPLFLHNNMVIKGSLIMNAGLEMKVANDKEIFVHEDGYVRILGSSASPVSIKGSTETRGWWKGLVVNSQNSQNYIDYLVLKNAGSTATLGVNKGGLIVGSIMFPAYLEVSNSVFADIDGCGVINYGGANIIESNLSYSNTDDTMCTE